MNSQTEPRPARAPAHLWIIGGVSLLWHCFGAFDYLMTQLQIDAYMSQFSQEQLAYFYGFPAWTNAAWALGVWGSFFGSVGLLVRKAWATWAFAISIVGLMGTSIYTMVLTEGHAIMGGIGILVFSVIIWVITIGLFFYSRSMSAKGVLR